MVLKKLFFIKKKEMVEDEIFGFRIWVVTKFSDNILIKQ